MPNDNLPLPSPSSQPNPKAKYTWTFEQHPEGEPGKVFKFRLTATMAGRDPISITGSFAPPEGVTEDQLQASAESTLPMDHFYSFLNSAFLPE